MTEDLRAGASLTSLVRELSRFGARVVGGDSQIRVTDVRQDSRKIRPGDLFVARPGTNTSGVEFVRDAVSHGAVAVLAERDQIRSTTVPVLEVDDVRGALAVAAEAVHGFPSRSVEVIGITGTNGKTTVAWLIENALRSIGVKVARLGTLGFSFGAESDDSSLTTPEADAVSRHVAHVRDRGGSHFVMEVSSHALAQSRVEGLRFAAAAFTNLSQDHLDYHETMQAYADAKARLFVELAPRIAVLNVDDELGRSLVPRVSGRALSVSRRGDADVRVEEATLDVRGIRARVAAPSATVPLSSPLVGEHNLENLLLALGVVEGLGFDLPKVTKALASVPPVPGRLERCDVPIDDVVVLVDYAHTPDALARTLAACRRLGQGRVICVFGCGGDRDADKRLKMGEAVGERADRVYLSNDNPRSEDPEQIARAVEPGLRSRGVDYEICLDRAEAIERAVLGADPGDLVLVAGKGHEPYQIVGTRVLDFDDRRQARRALALRRARLGH